MTPSFVKRKTKQFLKILVHSSIIWVFLTTILPQVLLKLSIPLQLNVIPSILSNTEIQLLIAHPDDEVMFFAPTLIELLKPKYNNTISVTCFSTGNAEGLGHIRSRELITSLKILGIDDVEIVDDETKFKDSMSLEWKSNDILEYIKKPIILTFDKDGISLHPNHISLFKAALASSKRVVSLKTWSFWEKYSSTIITNYRIVLKYVQHFTNDNEINNSSDKSVSIFNDLPSVILTIAAMSFGHQSQMVWFRWGWLVVSRYVNSNELIIVK
ncbi:hypothetical protein WICMUC_004068 [Wickerhamomyces mucosus]|uniref:N-acetylglucosaminylphosphatidylinositol deacetylase n=1 Tax=Wickerhamomyces mucosus TaxID=1378264 RepID=A0A9P8TC43_9ASCO|nr:hypothetical protein WICMUC_004068 [Wickerhamomyces mucosus]